MASDLRGLAQDALKRFPPHWTRQGE